MNRNAQEKLRKALPKKAKQSLEKLRNAQKKDNLDNQDDHERHSHQKERQRHRSSHNHRQETSENLKYKVQHFLNSIKASFTEGSSFDDENDEIGSGRRKGSSGSSGRRYRR